jgi:hypothetical protein
MHVLSEGEKPISFSLQYTTLLLHIEQYFFSHLTVYIIQNEKKKFNTS